MNRTIVILYREFGQSVLKPTGSGCIMPKRRDHASEAVMKNEPRLAVPSCHGMMHC